MYTYIRHNIIRWHTDRKYDLPRIFCACCNEQQKKRPKDEWKHTKIKLTSNKHKLTKMNWHVDFVMNARKLGTGQFINTCYFGIVYLRCMSPTHNKRATHSLDIYQQHKNYRTNGQMAIWI